MGNIFSERLKEVRTSQKLTQKQLAEKAHISIASYSSYEKGTKTPPLDLALRIAQALNVSLDWLCGKVANSGNDAPKSKGDVVRILSMIIDSDDIVEVSTETKTADKIDHLIRFLEEGDTSYYLPENERSEDEHCYQVIQSGVIKFHDNTYGGFFEEWWKLVRLVKDGTIPHDVYQIWLERKIEELSDAPLTKMTHWKTLIDEHLL